MSTARQSRFNKGRAQKKALFGIGEIFKQVYKKPDDARLAFQKMVDRVGFEKAYDKLLKKPSIIGRRKGSGILGALPFGANKERQQADQALELLGRRYSSVQETAQGLDALAVFSDGIKHELDRLDRKNHAQAERQKKLDQRYHAAELNPSRSRCDSQNIEARSVHNESVMTKRLFISYTKEDSKTKKINQKEREKTRSKKVRGRDITNS